MLLPWSRFLLSWDLVCSLALLVMCFYLPFRLAFLSRQMLSWPGDAWLLIIDGICLVDVVVAMSTAYYDYLGHLEARRAYIMRRYLRGWMLLDLLTCARPQPTALPRSKRRVRCHRAAALSLSPLARSLSLSLSSGSSPLPSPPSRRPPQLLAARLAISDRQCRRGLLAG